MTKLDDALELGAKDPKAQPLYYDLFLNSLFFIPVIDEGDDAKKENGKEDDEGVLPLLIESDGDKYLMLFDTIKRLTDWADEKTKYVALPGHAVTEMSLPKLYWALNYGTEQQKFFEPNEINWLKDIVRQAKEDEDQQDKTEDEQKQEQKEAK